VYSINKAAIPAAMGAATEVPSLRSMSSFEKMEGTMLANKDLLCRWAIEAPRTASPGVLYFSSFESFAESDQTFPFPLAAPMQITQFSSLAGKATSCLVP
jgi:hypothetical protein